MQRHERLECAPIPSIEEPVQQFVIAKAGKCSMTKQTVELSQDGPSTRADHDPTSSTASHAPIIQYYCTENADQSMYF